MNLAVLTVTADVDHVSDHDLLLGGVVASIAENRAAAEKWLRMLTYFRRREADDSARHAQDDHFALTARQQTAVEVGELWGMAESWVRRQLNVAICLEEHFEFAWGLCLKGQLDSYRATVIADAARYAFQRPEQYAALASKVDRFLRKHLKVIPGVDLPVVICTTKQLRNKLTYEIRKLQSGAAEERFVQAYKNRDVCSNDGEDGISWLTIGGTTDQIQLARQRLTLAAKQARASGDRRTLDQLRADLALDLIIHGTTAEVPLPAYARPVVNLTVPIQTVMGLADDPGVLSGGTVIPAGLARVIAQRPGATWHRMLTDAAGEMVELSTTRYAPTRPIWEQVVAQYRTCFRQGCDAAATMSEIDHRMRWSLTGDGRTSPANLWPACKTDHKAKHSTGFAIKQTESGGFALRTPAGFEHPIQADVHPNSDQWPDVEQIQYSATEIRTALKLALFGRRHRVERPDLEWEFDIPVRPAAPAGSIDAN